MLRIYLADLAHDLVEISQKTIPIGIGYIASYCKSLFDDSLVDFRLFRTLRPLIEECEVSPPDIIGLSCYVWNYNLNKKVAEYIKKRYPKCIIVFGGACISNDANENENFLRNHAYVDFLIFSEGESSFSHIVSMALDCKLSNQSLTIKGKSIQGAMFIYENSFVIGNSTELIADLDNNIMSPYMSGLLDKFLKNPVLVPIVQKVRGCPYDCVFCASGSQPKKLRSFSSDRVINEIEYIRKRAANRIIRFTDDNFGILDDDMEVAKYIRDSYDKKGYPAGIKLYTSKITNDRTRKIALLLKPLTLMCTSFETITEIVVKNSKRVNTSFEQARKDIEFSRENNIETGTETLFGLPGESVQSMKNVLEAMVDLRFDSISITPVTLLPATKLYTAKMRNEFCYKVKYILGENAITD